MPRPPLPIGSWGRVQRTEVSPGWWEARARFRDFDGVTRQVRRRARTGAAAERLLVQELTERTTPAAEDITRETRLSVVAAVWLAETESRELAINTLRRYREVLDDHVLPAVGGLAIREANVSRLDRFLKAVTANVGAPTAKLCRTVLSGLMGLAVRHGAITSNPVREVAAVTVTHREPRALTRGEVAALRDAARAWASVGDQASDAPRRGRPRGSDLPDIVDVLLGTGARIGEVLALRWVDVDLEAPAVTIAGTLVWEDQTSGPRRLIRQDHPKTTSSRRRLELPRFAADVLLRRRIESAGSPIDAVFASAAGTWRDPGSVRKQWRDVRDAAGLGWVTPHTFRRTVATLLDSAADLRTAADQLGHAGEDVTRRHYVQQTHEGPAGVGALLDGLVEGTDQQ